jgi:hypothetical protein
MSREILQQVAALPSIVGGMSNVVNPPASKYLASVAVGQRAGARVSLFFEDEPGRRSAAKLAPRRA